MACDLCNKVTTGLNDLLSCYHKSGVKMVCNSCLEKINGKNLYYRSTVATRLMNRYLSRNKKRKSQKWIGD